MPAPRCRPFTVLDGMILVAATAAGLRVGQPVWRVNEVNLWELLGNFSNARTFGDVHRHLTGFAFNVMPVLWIWTLTLPLLGLRRPRPTLRRLCRQPGFAACVAVFAASAVVVLGSLVSEARTLKPHYSRRLEFELVIYLGGDTDASVCFSFAVVGVWVLMALGKMGRRDPGWLDRTGRVLGAYWVVELVLSLTWIETR